MTTTTATTTATLAEQNTALVRDFMETVWNEGRTDAAARYVAADLAQHNPALPDGLAALTGLVDTLRGQLPELRFDIRRTVAEGELVVVHSLFTPAPGADAQAVVDIFRVEGGLIAEHWDVHQELPATTASGRPAV
ncbi:nuclear transport factor 2 family protein [Streptomyces sp. NRRL F-5123]|uniref:nuclear transport factor 2 family protein n=1 Tax=Streptomyces sp. NRRL F-5123 TaxID=1463856 RepID=UPI0006932A74|nr:nuclear transport factor 2 family protein [Streptomyces sp. NRRL F-5123]